jgi:hypothetical protein
MIDPELKKYLISTISKTEGYEKAFEIIDATEYVENIKDEKVDVVLEYFINVNQRLIDENIKLTSINNKLISFLNKMNLIYKILCFSIFIFVFCIGIFYFIKK